MSDRSRSVVASPIALVCLSVLFSLVAIELAVRLHDGRLADWHNFVREAHIEMSRHADRPPEHVYDPLLGWRPAPGYVSTDVNIDRHGLRVTGDAPPPSDRGAILLAGDSNTFGAEVSDGETWAAHLQRITGRRVLNAGVSAYGFDQTVLRAEVEAMRWRPQTIVIGFIAHDLPRMEASRLWGANRPYFDIVDGAAVLRNVPVPAEPDPLRPLSLLQRIAGHSYFLDYMIRRVSLDAPWYELTIVENSRGTGDRIACLLTDRLRTLQDRTGARVLLLAQYDTEVWQKPETGRTERAAMLPILDCARERGLQTLDTFDALAGWDGKEGTASLYKRYHLNDAGNRLLAGLVAKTLERLQERK
jgi:hypothetical protein